MALGNALASGQLRDNINVAPLIDVLLVLLITFMVIAPAAPHGLDVALPQRSAIPNPTRTTPLVVRVLRSETGQLSYRVNREDVRIGQLESRLSSMLAARADKVIFVEGDDRLDFSVIATVASIAKSAGADRIGLTTSRNPL